jgi:hypothetical protein
VGSWAALALPWFQIVGTVAQRVRGALHRWEGRTRLRAGPTEALSRATLPTLEMLPVGRERPEPGAAADDLVCA